MLKLVAACKTLQDFNTLQIVRFPFTQPYMPICSCDGPCECFRPDLPEGHWEQLLGEYMKDLEECAIEYLKRPKTGCLEGEGVKRITLRVIEFSVDCPLKVREHEVEDFDGKDP